MAAKGPLTAQDKQSVFTEWMKGDHIFIHLNARNASVRVPAHLKNQPGLTLRLSYLFHGKTEQDEEGVTAFLKFSGSYFECRVPWKAIWGMTSAEGEKIIWPEDVPAELVESTFVREAEKMTGAEKAPAPVPRPKPNLTAVHSLRPKERPVASTPAPAHLHLSTDEDLPPEDDHDPHEPTPGGHPPGAPSPGAGERRRGLTRIK